MIQSLANHYTCSAKMKTWIILLLLVVVQIGFGGYSIVLQAFAKNAGADSLVFSMLRDAFCAPILLAAAALIEGRLYLPRARELPFFFLLGITGMFGNQFGFIEGLYYSSPDVASIFQPLIPVFTAFFAFLVCMEKLPTRSTWYQYFKIFGILLGAGGAILMTMAKSKAKYNVGVDVYDSIQCTHNGHSVASYTWDDKSCHSLLELAHSGYSGFAKIDCSSGTPSFTNYTSSSCDDKSKEQNLATCLSDKTVSSSSVSFSCDKIGSKNKLIGIIFLLVNCSCMAVYILLQKRFIFGASREDVMKRTGLGRWANYPIHVTAHSYVFGALCMAIAAGIRFAMDGNTKVFIIPEETYGGLAYAVLVSSALCYGLITFCNKHVSSLVVTASWPVQVFVTVILSYFVFNIELVTDEYIGMVLIIGGMLTVAYGNYYEQKNPDSSYEPLLVNDE